MYSHLKQVGRVFLEGVSFSVEDRFKMCYSMTV